MAPARPQIRAIRTAAAESKNGDFGSGAAAPTTETKTEAGGAAGRRHPTAHTLRFTELRLDRISARSGSGL